MNNRPTGGTLSPGRELDALVAEKVMGWSVQHHLGNEFWSRPRRDPQLPPASEVRIGPPRYSTDIAAAWEVLTHLRSRRIYLTVEAMSNHFAVFEDCADGVHEEEETAPHAICIAALKAVGAL